MTFASTVFPLLLFFLSSVFYLVYWIPHQSPNVRSAVFKCLPILSLCLLVHVNQSESDPSFGRGIFWALVLSVSADALFIKPAMWTAMVGTLLFAVAQIIYMSTFGFDPWRWDVACISLVAFTVFVWYVDTVRVHEISVRIVCIGYLLLLFFMFWRVAAFSGRMAGMSFKCDALGTAALIGALSFVLSDLVIVVHVTVAEIPNRTHWVMSTYFLAQLGLVLAVYHTDYGCT